MVIILNKHMKKFVYFIGILFCLHPIKAHAQFEDFKDSVVQLYGVVMTADSLQALQSVTVAVKGQNRGTVTNSQGVFSIVVLKGDEIEFTSVGFRPKKVTIPNNIQSNQYSIVQLMVTDTVYLAATIIKARPSREQFERDFINTITPDDQLETARKNNNDNTRRFMMATLPRDGREASNSYLKRESAKSYYSGQLAPMNILNPLAWAEFVKAWKRGDFKKKS
jgi:CarboxypepD_reg-like domain